MVNLFSVRNFPQKLAGALLLRVREELTGSGLLHHDAVLHEHRLGRNIAGKAHLMGDHQHGHALLGQLPHDGKHLAGQLRVEGRGGLIKIDDLRVGCQRPGNGHTLLLAAGKLAGVVVRPVVLLRNRL